MILEFYNPTIFFIFFKFDLVNSAFGPLGVQELLYYYNRIYNKILDRDWFCARLFVTFSVRNHMGVQLQLSDLNFL